MTLREYRALAAAALAGIDEEWTVFGSFADSVIPPAFMVTEGPDPWRERFTDCADYANLEVVVIAHRLNPEASSDLIDDMTDAAVDALTGAGLRPYEVLRPAAYDVARVTYIAARIHIRHVVTVGGS